jgi:hypothetical protein
VNKPINLYFKFFIKIFGKKNSLVSWNYSLTSKFPLFIQPLYMKTSLYIVNGMRCSLRPGQKRILNLVHLITTTHLESQHDRNRWRIFCVKRRFPLSGLYCTVLIVGWVPSDKYYCVGWSYLITLIIIAPC